MANLLAAVNSTASGTAPASWGAMEAMTSGSVAVAGTGSVIRLKFMATATSGSDLTAIYRFAVDGSPVSGGPVLPCFMDGSNEGNGVTLTHYIDGLSAANHTFTVEWEEVSSQTASTTYTRRLEVVEWESGASIEVDVSASGNQALPSTFADITGLTGTFTTAASAGHMLVANLSTDPLAVDNSAHLRFAVDSTLEGPYGATWSDSAAAEDTHGCSMEYFKTGLSAASHDFSLQGDTVQGSPTCHASWTRTFQVIEFAGDFTLDVNVTETGNDTTVGGTMNNMTGTMTPDGSGSVVLVLASGVLAGDGSTDNCCVLQLADDASLVGAEVWSFYDEANGIPGFNVGYAVTGETAESVWTLNWESISGSSIQTGTLTRTLQIIDFSADAGAFTLTAAAGSYAWTGQAANLEYHSVVSAAADSYAWTGQTANLELGALVSAESGSYAWTGQAANLEHHAVLSAESGSYAWTGQDATLTYLTGATLTAEAGSYAWSGNDIGFLVNSLLKADAGSYLWTGQDAALTYDTGEVLGGGRKRRYILPDGKTTTDPEEALAEFRRQVAEEYEQVIPPKSRRKARKLKKQGLEIPTIPEMVAALPEPERFDPILVKEASIVVEDDEDAILAILSIL